MILRRRGSVLYKTVRNITRMRYLSTDSTTVWEPTVGLEIHTQIATISKLFSKASTEFTSPVNSAVSLFDCAMPGTMPVLNKKCVEAGVLTALALSCELNKISMFERKHYFYADMPAGFQITQQKKPLAVNGEISFYVFTPGIHKIPYLKTSQIKQIQLEQDSGKSLHFENAGKSLIDLNRAGIPLMELVFEPDLKDGEEAAALVKELCLILEILGTSSCKMEEGALRVDANVSVARQGNPLGTRTELKNIGSVRAVASAIKYEIERQIKILDNGGTISNETRMWDTIKNKTILMREKEERQDYRFMPETNLPPLYLNINEDVKNCPDVIDVSLLETKIPSLPKDIRNDLLNRHGIPIRSAMALMSNAKILNLFQTLSSKDTNRNSRALANFILNEVLTFLNKYKLDISFCDDKMDFIGETFDLRNSRKINAIVTTKVLDLLESGTKKTPQEIINEHNWYLLSDEVELMQICKDFLEKNGSKVEVYKNKVKKDKIFQSILGDVSLSVNRRADIGVLSSVLRKILNES